MRPVLTENHRRALLALLAVLQHHAIPYQFTGGLAGNIHGSRWPLHDIDIDAARADIPTLIGALDSLVLRPFSRFVDEEFDLYLATIQIAGVEVDISQVEEAFVYAHGERMPLTTDLRRAEIRSFEDHMVSVQPLDDLIAYKEMIGRTQDLADLRRLQKQQS